MSEPFRHAQRVAYDAAIEVATALAPGVTEKQAAARLEAALTARGVRRWFHQPFAWFGARTRFAGFHGPRAFFPSDARLEAGMVGILDVGPIVDGATADIGYTFRCAGAPDPRFDRAMETLREVRGIIRDRVERGDTMAAIYRAVDETFARDGFDNRHAMYPFGVLGHRVRHVRGTRPDPRIAGFGLTALAQMAVGELRARVTKKASPFWTADADRPPEPGIWSIEPHLGADGWGAKFEELLLVETGAARWLDDDLPHVH